MNAAGEKIQTTIDVAGLRAALTSEWNFVKHPELSKYPLHTLLFEQPRASSTDAHTRPMCRFPTKAPTNEIPSNL